MCIGPLGLPQTGQAFVTETWVKESLYDIVTINNNFEGKVKFIRLLQSFTLPFKVLRVARSKRPEVVYLSLKRSLYGAITDLICIMVYQFIVSGSVVIHLHGSDLMTLRNSWLGNAVMQRIWRYVTDVIILSPGMEEQLNGLPKRYVHVVRNFSNKFASAESVARKARHFSGEHLHILYLSNIMFSKGFSYLIDAVKILRAEGKNVTLTLAGLPLADDYLSAREAQLFLDTKKTKGITYVGALYGAEKWSALSAAHVLALPTFYSIEAQPICLIEGMAFGCVPLTTRHNYNEQFLDSKNAVFVDKKNVETIAKALRILMANPNDTADRMRNALKISTQNHTKAAFVESVDKIFEGVVKKMELRSKPF
jgi:glycosyltransferase involved in cell wall biosynthesis